MNSISIEPESIHKLVKVLVFFKKWFTEISSGVKDHQGSLKEHWKKFISRQTYNDLIRSIRGFIGLVSFVQMNHPDAIVVPRTTNQDDVENYFSLQRSRLAGGEPTVLQYMEGNSSLATSLLIKAEKKELDDNSFIGSYAALATPNFVSVPLKRKKKKPSLNSSNIHKVPDASSSPDGSCFSFNKNEVDNFHTQKDEQQLYRQAEQVFDHITIKSPSTIIGHTLKLVSVLREKQNKQHLLYFLKIFNFKLRHQHLMHGKWHQNSLNNALKAFNQDKELQRCWQALEQKVGMEGHQCGNVDIALSDIFNMFCGKFCKRRCVTYLAVDQLNAKNEEQKSAIRQMLRSFDKQTTSKQNVNNVKNTDKCFKCGETGHWAAQCKKDIPHDPAWLEKQQCYACGQKGHLKADCPLRIKASHTKYVKSTSELSKNKETNNDSLAIQLLRLPEVDLTDHPKLINLPSTDGSKHLDERFLQQGSDAWKQARKGKINGSKAASALGWRGRQEMVDYAQEVKSGNVTSDINDAMRWGSMCEDHALATYITHMPCTKFERTGLWVKKMVKGLLGLLSHPME